MSTNDPDKLARETIEEMIAERLIEEALNSTPASIEERFRNLDVQLAASARVFRDPAPAPHPDDLWTAERVRDRPSFWDIVPPANDPHADHPSGLPFTYHTRQDGRRAFRVGPISAHEMHLITGLIDTANQPIIDRNEN